MRDFHYGTAVNTAVIFFLSRRNVIRVDDYARGAYSSARMKEQADTFLKILL